MKIAVLFGSFNPLTNAHIAAMKSAVEALDADKGLFVATNGKYLRKKTVKIGDRFTLPRMSAKKLSKMFALMKISSNFGALRWAV